MIQRTNNVVIYEKGPPLSPLCSDFNAECNKPTNCVGAKAALCSIRPQINPNQSPAELRHAAPFVGNIFFALWIQIRRLSLATTNTDKKIV